MEVGENGISKNDTSRLLPLRSNSQGCLQRCGRHLNVISVSVVGSLAAAAAILMNKTLKFRDGRAAAVAPRLSTSYVLAEIGRSFGD